MSILPPRESIGQLIREWRRANKIKQEYLASILGTSQAAISRWENGVDYPSLQYINRIIDIISPKFTRELAVDRLFLSEVSSIEAIFDIDGIRLEVISRGLQNVWPSLIPQCGRYLEPYMIGESRAVIDNAELRREIASGEIAVISGVTDRHLNIAADEAITHRWVARFRRYGSRTLIYVVYEPCGKNTSPNSLTVLRTTDILIG